MTVSNGVNLEGFGNTGEQSGSNTINGGYSPVSGGAFSSKDVSSQGDAGLNREGSYDKGIRGESSGPEFSDRM